MLRSAAARRLNPQTLSSYTVTRPGLDRATRATGLSITALVGLLGLAGVLTPAFFVRAVSVFQEPPTLYLAAMIRVAVGAGLAWAASASRLPRLVFVFGVIIAIGGLATPFMGAQLARPILASWAAGGPGLVRAWGAAALALAALLLYAFSYRRSA